MDGAERRAQRQRIEEEAARLVVDRAPQADAPIDAELLRWAAQSPVHAVALAQARLAWCSAERLRALPSILADETARADDARRAASRRPSRRALLAGGIAATIVGATSAGLLWQAGSDRFATAIGERRSIALADGSRLHLNTDSIARVALSADRRMVELIRGEALFDVAHDALRPFIVTAGSTTLSVLGTAFNVRMRQDVLELVVARGLVGVEDAASGLQKVAGGNAAAIRDGVVAIAPIRDDAIAQRTAWQEGVIDFDGETLAEAVAEFNRYQTHPVVIGDPTLASIRLGGTFATNDSNRFISALESSFTIKAVRARDQSIILVRPFS